MPVARPPINYARDTGRFLKGLGPVSRFLERIAAMQKLEDPEWVAGYDLVAGDL